MMAATCEVCLIIETSACDLIDAAATAQYCCCTTYDFLFRKNHGTNSFVDVGTYSCATTGSKFVATCRNVTPKHSSWRASRRVTSVLFKVRIIVVGLGGVHP